MPRHELTPEERRRGQAKGAQTKRERREAAQLELDGAVPAAVRTLVAELGAQASTDRIRAATAILDRVLGRPRQAHDVVIDHDFDTAVAEARAKIAQLLAQRAERQDGE